MGSSNRHWPSMFKSKPCNTHHHHQWQHDINPSLMSSGCHRSSYPSVPICEERSPEPKPRWNPKPEQIRILEAIFNSGMVNPPRDEIRKIRAQLQEYGQVGDANVFYWFQNRKSRSKHKNRHLHNSKHQLPQQNSSITAVTAPSTSSSSSEKSSPKSADKSFPVGSAGVTDQMSNSPTTSVNQTYNFQNPTEYLPEPYFFPGHQTTGAATTSVFSQGFCYPELSNPVHVPADQMVANCSGLLLSDLMMNHGPLKKAEDEKLKLQQQLSYTVSTAPPNAHHHPFFVPPSTATAPSTVNHTLGAGIGDSGSVGPSKSMVFINDVAFEVAAGPFNVREAFGDDALLVHSSGQPVLTNEWGVTLHSLQHGGFYYLI